MADILDGEQLKRNILSDMRVELTEEFDKNFERKAFFTDKWKRRANPNAKGTLLMVTGTLRRSIKSEVQKKVSKTHNKNKTCLYYTFYKKNKKTNCFYYLCSFN